MIRKFFYLVWYNIRSCKNKSHIWMGIIFMFLFSNMMLNNTKEMIQKVGERPTVSSFPILWSDNLFLKLVFFTVIWMFSDAPFFDRMTTFLLVRSGKIIFAIAHIAYIVILSAVIPIIIYIAETVFLPYVQGNNWGNFWGTLAQTDIIAQVQGRITIDYRILWDFQPQQAMEISASVCFLLCCMTGLFLYMANLFKRKKEAVCVSCFLVILAYVAKWSSHPELYKICPYSWMYLDALTPEYNGVFLSVKYVMTVSIFINIILVALILIKTYRLRDVFC